MTKQTTTDKPSGKNKRRRESPLTPLSLFQSLTRSKTEKLLIKCKQIAHDSNWKLESLTKKPSEKGEKGIRPLLNKEALTALKSNRPKLCIRLINAYFSYYSSNLHAELLKAEANYSLNKKEEALKGLKIFSTQKDNKFYQKASTLCQKIIAEKANATCKNANPEEAIKFYVSELSTLNITPTYHEGLGEILSKLEPMDELSIYPELQKHELRLRFNSVLINILEKKMQQKYS